MKSTILGVFGVLVFTSSILAQISPTPVINNEIRDPTSMRMRSIELERVKKDANKVRLDEPSKEQAIKFAEIKEDFENIQKLESEIVKIYESGTLINFNKISDLATELSKKAVKLDGNLFIPKSDKQDKSNDKDTIKTKSVRNLIIELDNEIGNFVLSPIFTNNKLVDSKISEKSQTQLEKIIKLGEILSIEAKKRS